MNTFEQALLAHPTFSVLLDVLGQIAPRSRPVYENNVRILVTWMQEHGLTLETFSRTDAINYLATLKEKYEANTVRRMVSVSSRLFAELVEQGQRAQNPFERLRGIPAGTTESTYRALTAQEAQTIVQGIDTSTKMGKRDYALILLLLRTGIRRQECADLCINDLQREAGHVTLVIRHGKGDKRRTVKVPTDVFRALEDYIHALGREHFLLEDPLFVNFFKGDRPAFGRVTPKLIERVVRKYAKVTPHSLRATFITLALEGGAPLHKVQYSVGHSKPETTQRYHRRKLTLDDNAVDYVHVAKEE